MMTLLGICSSSAYPFSDERWKFLGIEESHCYDKYMISDLKQAAFQTGKPDWRYIRPKDASSYNSFPFGKSFFNEGQESYRFAEGSVLKT